MKHFKKTITLMLSVIMLCSCCLVSSAASTTPKPEHVCAFSVQWTCYNSFNSGNHTYISGWVPDPKTGVSSPHYSTCAVLVYQYKGLERCACGKTGSLQYDTAIVHSSCGQ